MLIRKADDIRSSQITAPGVYFNRREFVTAAGLAGAAVAAGRRGPDLLSPAPMYAAEKIENSQKSPFSTTEKITPENTVTHYNNYYEFSTEKEEPANLAKDFKTHPWTVTIEGAVNKKQKWDLDTILKFAPA